MYMYPSTAVLIFAHALSCYHCDSPDFPKNCPVVTCQQNEKCFVGSHPSSSGDKVHVYRCEATLCNDQSVALIGRAVENTVQPWESTYCCDKDLCNGNITDCQDDPNIDCAVLKDVICPSLETASKICRRTCNLCGSASQLSPTTTSVQVSMTPLTTMQQKTTTTTAPVHVNVTSASVAVVTPTTASFWLPWSSYNCETIEGICFGIRRRVCSTNITPYDCTGLDYDSELCSDSLCNVTCEDEPGFNCDRIKDIACIDRDLVNMCNRTCGMCVTGEATATSTPTAGATTTIKTTTTASIATTPAPGHVTTGCQDSPGFDCEPIKDVVCIDPDLIHRCNKTCGVCGHVTTGCQDSPGFDCEPIKDVVCIDPDLIHRCNKTCGVCGTCVDSRNCYDPDIAALVCADPELAGRYCAKTCNLC